MKLRRKSLHYYIATRYGGYRDEYNHTLGEYALFVIFGEVLLTSYAMVLWSIFFLILDPLVFDDWFMLKYKSYDEHTRSIILLWSIIGSIVAVLLLNAIKDRIKSPKSIQIEFED